MRKRPAAVAVAAIAVALIATSCSSTPEGSESEGGFAQRTLVHSSFIPESHPNSLQIIEWMDEVTERTDGAVTFETNFSGALCSATESLDCAADGRVDFASVTPAYNPGLFPTAGIDSMPFQVNDPRAFGKGWVEFFNDEVIEAEFANAGVKMFFGGPLAPFVLGTNEPVEDVADLKGRTIRSIGQLGTSLTELDVDVVGIGAGELYEALQRGVVDGYTITPDAVASYQLQEVTEYFYDLGAITGASTIQGYGMNLGTWESLEPELQEIMLEVGEDIALRTMPDFFDPYVGAACEDMISATNGFFPLTDETGWADKMRVQLLEDYIAATPAADTDALDRYSDIMDEAEAELDNASSASVCVSK